MKYLQESRKRIYVVLAILGATVGLAPMAYASTLGLGNNFLVNAAGGGVVNAVNGNHLTWFVGNSTGDFYLNNRTQYNFVGTGGNDTFAIWAGNSTVTGVATGVANDTFWIVSGWGLPLGGTPHAGVGTNSTFSLMTGNFGCFDILDNGNGTLTYAITAGVNTTINEYTQPAAFTPVCPSGAADPKLPIGPITGPLAFSAADVKGGYGTIYYSINIGDNSSILFNNVFFGTATINVVY